MRKIFIGVMVMAIALAGNVWAGSLPEFVGIAGQGQNNEWVMTRLCQAVPIFEGIDTTDIRNSNNFGISMENKKLCPTFKQGKKLISNLDSLLSPARFGLIKMEWYGEDINLYRFMVRSEIHANLKVIKGNMCEIFPDIALVSGFYIIVVISETRFANYYGFNIQ